MHSANWHTTATGLAAGAIASVLLILMARMVIDHVPLYDELLHILSARQLLASGRPAILDGLYERAEIFTRAVAFTFERFGDTPVAARLPALGFAVGLIFLIAVWVTRRAGFLCGLASVVILVLVPATLELAVFARFYTFHALVIAAMGIIVYEASLTHRRRVFRGLSSIAVLALTVLGLHLQETTVIAFGALMAGLMAVLVMDQWTHVQRFVREYPVQLGIGSVIVVLTGLAIVYFSGLMDRLMEAPLWARHSATRPHYYLFSLSDSMPLLWPMFPLMVLASWSVNRRLTLFCLTTFTLTFVVHSVAAQKSVRYIYYSLPFFSIIFGSGIAGIIAYARSAWAGEETNRHIPQRATILVMATALVLSLEGQHALKTLTGKLQAAVVLSYGEEADWSPAVATLAPWVHLSSRVVTSNAMKSIFYLGGYDYELNASIVGETDTMMEFGTDERTGKQAIGSLDSVRKVLDMQGQTLVVLEQETMNLDSGVSSAAVRAIESRCKPIALPASATLGAWHCDGSIGPTS